MSLITNFDTLANLRREAQIGGVGSKAYFAFCDTMFESFPKIYEQAKAANAEISKNRDNEPRLTAPAMVGNARFHAGVRERMVIEAAQRRYQLEVTPEKEAERIKKADTFIAELHKELGWVSEDGKPAQQGVSSTC